MSDCAYSTMAGNSKGAEDGLAADAYVSCIKINGRPILPPLVTSENRLELEEYKKQAIEVERRLKCQRELKLFIKRLNLVPQSKSPCTFNRTLEHILSFGDDDAHCDALNVPDTPHLPMHSREPQVPSLEKRNKAANLTCNIFDVTQYSDSGIILFGDVARTFEIDGRAEANLIETQNNDNAAEGFHQDASDNSPECLQPVARTRSNSYTLESPSPALLEHLQKQARLNSSDSHAFEMYSGPGQRSSVNSEKIASETNQNQSFEFDSSTISRNVEHDSTVKKQRMSCDVNAVMNGNQAVQDLVVKHFGTNNRSNTQLQKVDEVEVTDNYAKRIMDFLERHTQEQEMKVQSYEEFKQKLFEHNSNLNNLTKNHSNVSNGLLKDDCGQLQKLSPTNSLNDTFNALSTSTPLLIDFESDSCVSEPIINFGHNSTQNANAIDLLTSYDPPQVYQTYAVNCNRELFPEKPERLQRKQRERWAATILTAAAKGYLIRRLKRTERVRNLIQIIQEALLCAVNLHMEATEDIQPPDVELHRRLLQQVSAACYEFYEVFFTLTTREQMAIIAQDRQRIKEKQNRPKSVSSIGSDTSRSSTKAKRSSFTMRQRKSLTSSLAA